MAGSSTVRQSKTILARSVKRAGTLQILAIVLQGPNVHEGRYKHSQGCARRKRSFTRTPSASAGASRLLPSKTNAAKVGCALLLGTTVIASDFAADQLNFRNPQQDLIDNVSELLRETKELQICEKQQEEALQRFLEAGLSLNAAALMAHNQYPCDSTDQ